MDFKKKGVFSSMDSMDSVKRGYFSAKVEV